jgi:hypothetical protein
MASLGLSSFSTLGSTKLVDLLALKSLDPQIFQQN